METIDLPKMKIHKKKANKFANLYRRRLEIMKKQNSTTKYRNFIDEYNNTEGIKKKPTSKFEDLKIDPDSNMQCATFLPPTRYFVPRTNSRNNQTEVQHAFSADDVETAMKNIYQTPNEFNITIDNRTPKDSFHKENDNIDSLKFPNISRTVILTEKDDTTDQRTENEDIDIVSKMITHDLAPSESGPTGSITDRGENQSYQRIIISESVPKIQKKPNHKLNTLFPRRIHKLFNQQCKSHLTFAKKPMSPKPPQKPSPVPLQPIDPLERTRIDYITSTATTNIHPFESSKSAANLLAEIPSCSDKQAPSHSMNTDL